MLQVWKYPIPLEDTFALVMQKDARVLSVQVQFGKPCIWALVNPEAKTEDRRFRLAGTGYPIDENAFQLKFIGTVQLNCGDLIFHLFEVM